MIIREYDLDTPSIYVYYCDDVEIDEFKEVLWGIEEEGIPYKVEKLSIIDSKKLSYKAALNSRLSVGIGVSKDKITLTTNKLDKDEPLISIDLNKNYNRLRNLGSNSARLVKKIQFKEI